MMKTKNEKRDIDMGLMQIRNYKVVKANELIQKSRFNLQLQEQKIILYLISKIKPEDMKLKEHCFEIKEFCRVCGLDDNNGANYKYIKQTLKNLRDKSIWIMLDDGSETVLAWIDTLMMQRRSGMVTVGIAERMKPYLLQLKEHYTQYELLYILAMKSQYSIRLYELLKSYEFQQQKVFETEELKVRISAEKYTRFLDFKRNVLDISMREINRLSDLNVIYSIVKEGRRYAKIEFSMKVKEDLNERLETWAKIDEIISPNQTTLLERMNTF